MDSWSRFQHLGIVPNTEDCLVRAHVTDMSEIDPGGGSWLGGLGLLTMLRRDGVHHGLAAARRGHDREKPQDQEERLAAE